MSGEKRGFRYAEAERAGQVIGQPERRYGALMLPLILVFMAAPILPLYEVKLAARNVRAFVVIDGSERPIRVGDVLAQGRLVDVGTNPYCAMPDTTYGLAGAGYGQVGVSLELTSDCQLVVSAIILDLDEAEIVGPNSEFATGIDPADPSQPGYERTFVSTGPEETGDPTD